MATTDEPDPVAELHDARPIVVVEDEDAIRDVVVYNLERAGYVVRSARDGAAGLELIRSVDARLVVLDLMLPGLDGLDVCRALRADERTAGVPVIMLTARAGEEDVLGGLGVGADDYLTKPFSTRELVARVATVLRRSDRDAAPATRTADDADAGGDEADEQVVLGAITVTPARHEVLVDGVAVRFTRTELQLLLVLVRRPGRVFTRERLVAQVMGDDAWITERTIDVHVRAIRRKLGEHAELVETIRGVGYRARDLAVRDA